jgi:predicted DNA-binding transcriptional regulator AlpA
MLTEHELAAELQVSLATLQRWRLYGGVGLGPRWVKVGKHVRYRREDVQAWLDENTREGAADGRARRR